MSNMVPYLTDSRPLVRWWWFAGVPTMVEICEQLDWFEENGFGGVEIAWVYGLDASGPVDQFLGDTWKEKVARTARQCRIRGLSCDFTFGSLWPFGGSFVSERYRAKTFTGLSSQVLTRSWEVWEGKRPPHLIDHLQRAALEHYDEHVGAALQESLIESGTGSCALFCDSWEVEPEALWTDGLGERFEERYGYRLEPYMDSLDAHPAIRFDYRMLISDTVLAQFYEPFAELCHKRGALARIQAHGAPADLLSAYATADIPESEALLFDPGFSLFAASAAAIMGRPVVTAEAFTCLYGWNPFPGPGPHQGEEYAGDIKLVGDALIANGVNHLIWHGAPYQSSGSPNAFYASVHVAPDGALAPSLRKLNSYFEKICSFMKWGKSFASIGVYVPTEDAFRCGELPRELWRPSARYYWEMQYTTIPEELRAFRPMWISAPFLEQAYVKSGSIYCNELVVPALFVNADWISERTLSSLLRLSRDGAEIWLNGDLNAPGYHVPDRHPERVEELRRSTFSGYPGTSDVQTVLVTRDTPDYWVRTSARETRIFVTHPATRQVTYPLRYQQAKETAPLELDVKVTNPCNGHTHGVSIRLTATTSIGITMTGSSIEISEFAFMM